MLPDPKGADKPRPLVLYVKHVTEVTDLPSRSVQPITALDVEMSRQDVYELVKILCERLGEEAPGAIRVRLMGTLVIT